MQYEKGVTDFLGKENYELCQTYCDNGWISTRHVEEIAQILDQRIFGALRLKLTNDQDLSTRNRFRFVMSKWFNLAHEGNKPESQFNVFTLIELFQHPNLGLYKLACDLSKMNMVRPDASSAKSETNPTCPKRGSEKDNKDTTESDGARGGSSNFAEDDSIPTHGRRVPLNAILINAVSYQMRDKNYDEQLMTVFAVKIGKEKLLQGLLNQGVVGMDVIIKRLLEAWSMDMTATEENLLVYL